MIDQDGNENRGKTMINQSCFMELEIGDRVQVFNIFFFFFFLIKKVLVPPWGTGRCDSRPGLVLSIVERSSFVGRLLLRLLLRDYIHTFEG